MQVMIRGIELIIEDGKLRLYVITASQTRKLVLDLVELNDLKSRYHRMIRGDEIAKAPSAEEEAP